MFHTILSIAMVVLALFGTASAHMTLKTPVPYGQSTLDTSPLKPDKSNYPCKLREGVYDITQQNIIPVGVPQELSFSGSASHGGGTCQLSISLDKEPTASSVFKLIQVFEGGCPTAGAGNDGSDTFSFTVPKGFPNGDFALAWVWYNRIGNREVYMNCAPITVTGGADNNDLFDSLPNQYMINLPPSECSSVETSDQIIPNPGQYVVKAQGALLSSATGPSCAAAAAAQTESVKGYKSAASGDSASSGVTEPASSTAHATSAPGYNNGQYSAPASTTAAVPTSAPVASSSTTASAPAAYPTLSVSSGAGVSGPATGIVTSYGPAGTGSTTSGSTPSSGNGIVCDDAHAGQYGVEVAGKTVWRQVAPGTTCQEVSAYRLKRSMRHAHVRRHIQNGGFF
ncbi:hypothetical protein Slin15195_G005150 [Septoria linicola]|uniref:Lytic polysaccharide monooxygenase n=1 Tax=Septoria linicola TaxID=215465 RepID=A0A9Q9AJR1_9PEZI|nr:hypothetical protein Slin14017_G005190 [Septoria linicola]USW47196.1 hypothetical protein Slin15195_G005150 [Septoria linicola]